MKGLSITTKLRLIITVACLAAILLTTCALVAFQWSGYKRNLPITLMLRARILALNSTAALAFKNVADAEALLSALRLDDAVTHATIFDAKGNIFAKYSRLDSNILPIVFKANSPHFEFSNNTITVWAPIELQEKRIGTLAFSRNLDDLRKRLLESVEIAAGVTLVVAVLAFWLSDYLQGLISAPLLKLTAVAKRVTENQDFDLSPEISGNAEIGVLSTAFSQMLSALHERDRKIRSHADELERKVIERTELLEHTNKELQMFGYSVSHDLRSPLRSIQGFSEMLEESERPRLSTEGAGYLARIRKSADKMSRLIDGLLNFSKLGKGELAKSNVDMAAMVKEVVDELVFQTRDRTIDIQIDPLLPEANADPALIRQVWANLLSNAFKFTRQKNLTFIIIGARKADDGAITYFVKDNGAGFDNQHASKLFHVFERLHSEREFEGSGIGLATVHRILERHGGRIWANSSLGEGTTFHFTV